MAVCHWVPRVLRQAGDLAGEATMAETGLGRVILLCEDDVDRECGTCPPGTEKKEKKKKKGIDVSEMDACRCSAVQCRCCR